MKPASHRRGGRHQPPHAPVPLRVQGRPVAGGGPRGRTRTIPVRRRGREHRRPDELVRRMWAYVANPIADFERLFYTLYGRALQGDAAARPLLKDEIDHWIEVQAAWGRDRNFRGGDTTPRPPRPRRDPRALARPAGDGRSRRRRRRPRGVRVPLQRRVVGGRRQGERHSNPLHLKHRASHRRIPDMAPQPELGGDLRPRPSPVSVLLRRPTRRPRWRARGASRDSQTDRPRPETGVPADESRRLGRLPHGGRTT